MLLFEIKAAAQKLKPDESIDVATMMSAASLSHQLDGLENENGHYMLFRTEPNTRTGGCKITCTGVIDFGGDK